jgi:hypothetical protein
MVSWCLFLARTLLNMLLKHTIVRHIFVGSMADGKTPCWTISLFSMMFFAGPKKNKMDVAHLKIKSELSLEMLTRCVKTR